MLQARFSPLTSTRAIDLEMANPLLAVRGTSFLDHTEGFSIARRGFQFHGQKYDVIVDYEETNPLLWQGGKNYPLALSEAPSHCDQELLHSVGIAYEKTTLKRHLIRVPEIEDPFVVDVYKHQGNRIDVLRNSLFWVDLEMLRREDPQSQAVAQDLEWLMRGPYKRTIKE